MASVAHQTAIKTTTAATDQPTELKPAGSGKRTIAIKNIMPNPKTFLLIYLHIKYINLLIKKRELMLPFYFLIRLKLLEKF